MAGFLIINIMHILKRPIFLLLTLMASLQLVAQQTDSLKKFRTVIAGPEYKKSGWHNFWWGNNYRDVWTTPVSVPLLYLDTAKGGLKPEKEGGGHQTKSLHVKAKNDKEYAIRSVDKTLGAVLPEDFKGTFLEKQVDDEVSMSNPFGAAIVPALAKAAKIYHTNPEYVYMPAQNALDTFNKKYGNNFYLFEEKTSGNWSNASNLGNFDKFYDTKDVIEKLLEDNNYRVDEKEFARARIFDWFINDWDRHEDQWSWGIRKKDGVNYFEAVPQDRDQAFFKHNGILLNTALSAGGLNYMQPFADNLKDVKTFTYEERNLDRFFTKGLILSDWQNIAEDLQQSFTDAVIDDAVKKLPPEIFRICGKDIDSKLKVRRTHLVEWATTYYYFISKQVQINGTKKNEIFEINNTDTSTSVNVFATRDIGTKKDDTLYSRTFHSNETNEIRLFGADGKDVYKIDGSSNSINIKIIAGKEEDSVLNNSTGKILLYDDKTKNYISNNASVKLRLSNDTSVHTFNYDWFKYNKSGLKPSVFYSYEDRIYVGFGYGFVHNAWRKKPFASKQLFDVHYSLSQKAFSFTYSALVPKLIGNTDFSLLANYDLNRWFRFWGLGNETQFPSTKDVNYFTANTRQWIFQPLIIYHSNLNTITGSVFAQGVNVLNNDNKFISSYVTDPQFYKWKTFAGAEVNYSFKSLNDSVTPTKGFMFFADATGSQNLKDNNSYFLRYSGNMQLYVPLFGNFSYVLRAGAATTTGNPELYQYNTIGGAVNLRGYRRDRFWGKSAYWNMNDLRFISNIKSYYYRGKAGLIVFFDDGRVWMPGENSNTIHADIGAGITLAPFNKILADVTYGVSKDGGIINVRINKYF